MAGSGLAKFDGTNWTTYNLGNLGNEANNLGYEANYVWTIAIDGEGNKWIGTYGSGLIKFDGTNWTVYNTSNSSIPDNYVTSIAIDTSGDIWIGTYGGGGAKFDGTNWTIYNTTNSGLTDDRINAIAIDEQGNKWFGTDFGGLNVYNESGIVLTAVNRKGDQQPTTFSLSQNYPNPFNPSTAISYQVSSSGQITLKVYDVLGREVATLVNAKQNVGNYAVRFDASKLSSGVYFYRLDAVEYSKTMKMILVK